MTENLFLDSRTLRSESELFLFMGYAPASRRRWRGMEREGKWVGRWGLFGGGGVIRRGGWVGWCVRVGRLGVEVEVFKSQDIIRILTDFGR